MQEIRSHLENHRGAILGDVERLVRLESPSNDREGINRAQDLTAEWFGSMGEVGRHPSDYGDLLHVRFPGATTDRMVLLAHVDTVYPVGSWNAVWRTEGERALGPGAYDMKGGIVQAAWALRALLALGRRPARTIDLLLTPDEEIGSDGARPLIEDLARGAYAVLVLEPPYMNGDLKIARKGVGDYTIRISGRSSHQGVEPEKGRNAIVSAAHLIRELIQLQDLEKGTTLGPNVIQGGTVSNVVADEVILKVDVRVWDLAEATRLDTAIRSIRPLEGTTYNISGGLNRPPMEPSDGTMKLLEKAQAVAQQIGFNVGAARVGGGSDGNFTSHLAPTLDGFGALGANAHQKNLEHIHIPSLVPRTALLAGMLMEA
ncbi:MAG: M20 family metallopeptidase [Chloroflexota bacterium]